MREDRFPPFVSCDTAEVETLAKTLRDSALSTSDGPTKRASSPLAPGTRLGSYEIVRHLGSGGMGTVYEAQHTLLRKRVALKVLHDQLAAQPKSLARFVAEGRAAAGLQCSNVVDVFDVQTAQGHAFLVLEYLAGHDLKEELRRRGRLPLVEVLQYMLPVLRATSMVHERGIIHRDLKPSNIFLADTDAGVSRPVVLDFGISKGLHELSLTESRTFLGTAAYAAPEQIRSGRLADASSDQFSLGVILYECLTGHNPFLRETLLATLHAVVEHSPPPPSRLAPGLSAEVDTIVLRALSQNPNQRFPSVIALADALGALDPGSEAQEPIRRHVSQTASQRYTFRSRGSQEIEGRQRSAARGFATRSLIVAGVLTAITIPLVWHIAGGRGVDKVPVASSPSGAPGCPGSGCGNRASVSELAWGPDWVLSAGGAAPTGEGGFTLFARTAQSKCVASPRQVPPADASVQEAQERRAHFRDGTRPVPPEQTEAGRRGDAPPARQSRGVRSTKQGATTRLSKQPQSGAAAEAKGDLQQQPQSPPVPAVPSEGSVAHACDAFPEPVDRRYCLSMGL